jgi:3-hydroxymyristoyl/3-hydroxydecanoyl-(acyl carrier protein) dehydratase
MNYSEFRKAAQTTHSSSFSSELDVFNHHFEASPLLPGALSALLLSEICGGESWFLKKIIGLRFRKPLTPGLQFTVSSSVVEESNSHKICLGQIISDEGIIAYGQFEFVLRDSVHTPSDIEDSLLASPGVIPSASLIWTGAQIREYLPHGELIVLIDELVDAKYPAGIKDYLEGSQTSGLDQALLLGTKVHTRSILSEDNFWLDHKTFPLPILSELVAQAGALTLAPFFKGTKPQVSLLGCDTEYFAQVSEGATIDTHLELTRVKRLGSSHNMIIFKSECFVGPTKVAQINLNAMASF